MAGRVCLGHPCKDAAGQAGGVGQVAWRPEVGDAAAAGERHHRFARLRRYAAWQKVCRRRFVGLGMVAFFAMFAVVCWTVGRCPAV